jgi:hypothetical protein
MMLSTKVENSSLNGAPICVLRGTAYRTARDMINIAWKRLALDDNQSMQRNYVPSCTLYAEAHVQITAATQKKIMCSTVVMKHTPEAIALAQVSGIQVSSKQCAGPPAVVSIQI